MAKKVATGPPKEMVAKYLNAPYIRMIIPNAEEGGYLAEVLELPGCISEGQTPEQAFHNVEEAMKGWIFAALDLGKHIPEPVGANDYSGNIALRVSSELHRLAALRAMQDGVSLNQWIAKAITTQLANQNMADELADRVANKVAQRVRVTITTTSLEYESTPPAVLPTKTVGVVLRPDHVLTYSPRVLNAPIGSSWVTEPVKVVGLLVHEEGGEKPDA